MSAAIYPRFHAHILSKLAPKFKSRKSSIIVLFNTQIIFICLLMSFFLENTMSQH